MFRKILVPLDRSHLAESVLPHVEELAKQQGTGQCEVTLFNVCEVPLIPEYYLSDIPLNWNDHIDRCNRDAEKYLSEISKKLTDVGINATHVVHIAKSGEGNAADYIVDFANNNQFDLIVLSTHGRSGISRWAFGSVSDKVMRRATVPILLIKPVRK